MAETYDLDLDALAPESKKVKLNGRIIEVNPPKFKNLVALMKLANTMGEGNGGQTIETVDMLRQSLIPLIPALGEEDFDLTMEQLNTLLQFVMTIATPQDQTTLEKQGYSVGEITTEKKTEDSPE